MADLPVEENRLILQGKLVSGKLTTSFMGAPEEVLGTTKGSKDGGVTLHSMSMIRRLLQAKVKLSWVRKESCTKFNTEQDSESKNGGICLEIGGCLRHS